MRVVCISDTHERHRSLNLPEGDLLIHAGDITYSGEAHAIKDFLDWFEVQPHPHKVFIAGNHDFLFESIHRVMGHHCDFEKAKITYLNDSRAEIDGLKIWGSPWTPTFGSWAFMKNRGDEIAEVWNKIPYDTDILITHGPPKGVLDMTPRGQEAGCWDLMAKVRLIKPKLHVFGHIHGGYGIQEKWGTKFVNASICDEDYDATHSPIVVDI